MSSAPLHWFGTDGIRNVAGEGPLTAQGLARIGRAFGRFAVGRSQGDAPRILLAGDPRPSTPDVIRGLTGALESVGARAIELGTVPTPTLAWLTADGDFDLGVMVSASHNPPEYNGIKPFLSTASKLTRAQEEEIEALLAEVDDTPVPADPPRDMMAPRRYIEATCALLAEAGRLDGMRLVVDLAAGAATTIAPDVLRALGAEVTVLHEAGTRAINDDCGSQHPGAWLAAVEANGADAGLAFDGDADRILIATPRGELLDGDDILAILAQDAHAAGGVPAGSVVSTVMANLGLEERLAEFDTTLLRTPVGDRQVAERMRESGAIFGGEPSGHVVLARSDLPQDAPALIGDALVAGVKVLQAARRLGLGLGELRAARPRVPQLLVGVRVSERRPLDEWSSLQDVIRAQEAILADRGRLVIRYSGTEPLLRIMAEGRDAAQVDAAVQAIREAAEAG